MISSSWAKTSDLLSMTLNTELRQHISYYLTAVAEQNPKPSMVSLCGALGTGPALTISPYE